MMNTPEIEGVAHEQELVETYDDVQFINDSKAIDVTTTAQALGSYDVIYWIAGGQSDTADYNALTPYLGKVRHSFLIGEDAPQLAAWLEAQQAPYTLTETLQRAVQAAAHMAWEEDLEGATVLFSPACASLDQSTSLEARGELFRNAVHALKVEAAG